MSWTALALRPVLLVVAVLGLLGPGGVELAPRAGPPAGAPAVSVPSSTAGPTGPPAHRADGQTQAAVSRPGLAVASVPGPGGGDLPPVATAHVPAHPAAAARSRPSSAPYLASAHDAAAGRAPPTTTGTGASLSCGPCAATSS